MARLIVLLKRLRSLTHLVGPLGTTKYVIRRIFSGREVSGIRRPSPVKFYSYIYSKPFGCRDNKDCDGIINWVIPDFDVGSGGHLTIFRVINVLEKEGFICRIVIDGESKFSDGEAAKRCIVENFVNIQADVAIGRDELKPAAATFATSWNTAYTVRDYKFSGKKYYFVQDFEPFFYAHGSEYFFAEQTYRFGLKGIVAGGWLESKLSRDYGMEAVSFGFSVDKDIYGIYRRRGQFTRKVFFYARPVTPRRAFEIGLLALARVHQQDPSIEFVFAGWDLSGIDIPFPHYSAGVVSPVELSQLLSDCDIALVLSLTNLSLMPLECMACGCAVVSNAGDNVEWLLDKSVVRFCELTPESISDAILSLFKDEKELCRLQSNGRKFALSTDWNNEISKIVRELKVDLSQST